MNIIKRNIQLYQQKRESSKKMIEIGDAKITQLQLFKSIRKVLPEELIVRKHIGKRKDTFQKHTKGESTFQ